MIEFRGVDSPVPVMSSPETLTRTKMSLVRIRKERRGGTYVPSFVETRDLETNHRNHRSGYRNNSYRSRSTEINRFVSRTFHAPGRYSLVSHQPFVRLLIAGATAPVSPSTERAVPVYAAAEQTGRRYIAQLLQRPAKISATASTLLIPAA